MTDNEGVKGVVLKSETKQMLSPALSQRAQSVVVGFDSSVYCVWHQLCWRIVRMHDAHTPALYVVVVQLIKTLPAGMLIMMHNKYNGRTKTTAD